VVFRVRATLRRRWLSVLVVTGIVALVTGTVLTLAAGARRTAAAPDAYTEMLGGELDATVEQESGPPRTAEVAALPGVASVEGITFIFATVTGRSSGEGAIALAGSRLSTARLVAGRPADPADPHEFVASRDFVDEQGAQLGDRIPLVSWTREQIGRGGFPNEPPQGYSFDAELVGVFDAPEGLETAYSAAFVSPGLFDAEPVVSGQTIMSIRLEPGATSEELRAGLDGLPEGSSFTLKPGRIVPATIRGAVDAQARGIWLMAAVAAIGAVVALGQILSRHVRLADIERRPLQAVGSTNGQLAGESLSRAAVPALAGTAIGAFLAVAASGFFPTGFVRRIEPDLGVHVDAGVLLLGSLGLVFALLVWVGVALLGRPTHSPAGPSAASEALARSAPSPAAATGVRFALPRRPPGRSSRWGCSWAASLQRRPLPSA
jgi:hypothetical protein